MIKFRSLPTLASTTMRLAIISIQISCGLAVLAGSSPVQPYSGKGLRVGSLTCEYLTNPEGIAEPQPRLGWIGESGERGQKQTAFRVLVASSAEKLAKDTGDLWDSGKVASSQSIHVNYVGAALKSRQECFWKVCVWDKDGKRSGWSQPARWSMGLLQPTDWEGKWIGKDEVEKSVVLQGTDWIWFPEGNPPPGIRYFRRVVELPANRAIKSARLIVAADNLSVIFVNGSKIGNVATANASSGFDVAALLQPGRNVLAVSVENLGDSPNPAGLLALLKIEFTTGAPLVLATDASWKTAGAESSGWEQPAFDEASWVPAKKLGPAGMQPWGATFEPDDRRLPAHWLRKEFHLAPKIRRATVSYSGLGLSELYLNGKKVGDEVLSPGLTDYSKRAFYVTHEVTDLVKRGDNAIGVVLGNGRFFSPRLRSPMLTANYGFPKLLLQMRVEYADGSVVTNVVSDETWKLTTVGPIRANNEYDGEEHDARMELTGWAKPGFDDSRWERPQLVAAPGGEIVPQMIAPIRVTGTLKPVKISEPQPGVFIYDMGQNMVGWCRLEVSGPGGTQISLRFSETLQPDGTLYLDNIREAKVTDRYTLKGGGTEIWEPRFTYHGFRFVEVRGWPGRPTLESLEGRVVNDDLASAGEFSCSQPMINRIYQNILWGVRGNYRSLPTDCPQRDERQAWLGDRSAECRGETYLFNIAALYAKWTQDMTDAQKSSGSIPDVCPPYWPLYNDSVTWPSSAVIIPGTLRDQYADQGLIARQYPSMVKWIDYMSRFITNGIISKDSYGDWCVPPEDPKLIHSNDPARKTEPALIATSYFHYCLKLMAGYAMQLGKPADAGRFTALAEQLKAALNEKFYNHEKGFYDNGTQTACVLPLAFNMVPPDQRARVFDHLVKKITEESRGHIATGLIGGQWLNRVLTAGGRPDLAFGFVTNTAYPSWGYMAEQGATTIWELWNGNTANPAMNSGNHVMLVGDLVIWLYENLAGIAPDPARPGFKHILMCPQPVGGLRWVKASHDSPYGWIASEWRIEGGKFWWKITVPANTTATVSLPAGDNGAVSESGRPLGHTAGVRVLRVEANAIACEVSSGSYEFELPWQTEVRQ
jgi:alpha-L-rhamnosidase